MTNKNIACQLLQILFIVNIPSADSHWWNKL